MSEECNGEKVGYKSKKLAKTALNIIKSTNHNRHTIPCREYYCEDCNLWHLTSHEENDGIGGKLKPILLKYGKRFKKLIEDNNPITPKSHKS